MEQRKGTEAAENWLGKLCGHDVSFVEIVLTGYAGVASDSTDIMASAILPP